VHQRGDLSLVFHTGRASILESLRGADANWSR